MMNHPNPLKRTIFYIWYHRQLIFWVALALGGWYYLNHAFEAQAAVIGPEFLTRACVKLFGIAIAAWISFHADKWLAPTVKNFCDRPEHDVESEFEKAWRDNPGDPRIRICVDFYKWLFIGLALVFAL